MAFQNAVVGGGGELVRDVIRSRGYVAGASGWMISRDGSAEFNNVTVRGVLVVQKASDSMIIGDPGYASPAITFYKNGIAEPAAIIGDRPFGTGVTGIEFASAATAGHDRAIMQLDEFGWRIIRSGAVNPSLGIDFDLNPNSGWAHAEHPGGLSALNALSASTYYPLVQKGRVGVGTTVTAISNVADTNIIGANGVNIGVIAGRAYLVFLQLDYFRATTGALNRLQVKLWDGAVGVTQLGAIARIVMVGPLNTLRRTLTAFFMFTPVTTHTIANLNVTVQTNDATVGQDWSAEVNTAYTLVVMETGLATLISGL